MLGGALNSEVVAEYSTRVTVNGIDRPALSVSMDGSWRSDLPDGLSSGSNGLDRSGKIVWATQGAVHDHPVTSFRGWGEWSPRRGDKVVIYVGDGETEWPRFTGLIDETTGSVGGEMSSSIVGDVDRLSEAFKCEALLEQMPPLPGTTTWRWAGLSAIFLADAAMRAGGYYTTPPRLDYTALSLPLQTSLLPEVGSGADLISGASHTGGGAYQQNWGSPWGYCAGNFKAEYSPAFNYTPSQQIQMSMMVTSFHAGNADVFVDYGGSSNYLRLLVSAAGNAVLQRNRGGTLVEVCRIMGVVPSATRVEVLVKNGSATMRTNDGRQATGSVSGLLNDPMSRVRVNAEPDARVAGVMVSHPPEWQEFQNLNFKSTAHIDSRVGGVDTWGMTNAMPRFETQEALAALEQLADATLSAMWLDEEGVLNFAPSGAVRNSPVVQTITTANDVLALSWSDRLLAVASRITVAYRHAAYKRGSGLQQIELARGSRQTLSSGMVTEDVYTPEQDEDWYGVDATPRKLGAIQWEEYNGDDGTFVGVSFYQDNDVVDGIDSSLVDIVMSKTGISEYTITHTAGSLPAGVVAETATHPSWTALWERNRGKDLPLIQGWGRIAWIERETTTATNQPGPVLRVDVGAYGRLTIAERIRDYLKNIVENALPQVSGLDVIPDPRRQIGDTITIASESFLGVTITGTITGISEGVDGSGYTQALDVEPRSAEVGALTWQEWESAFPGTLTYDQWRALRGSVTTYTDFENDPLRGAE